MKVVAGFVLGAILLLGVIVLWTRWPMINVVETGQTPQYPQVQPRHYREDRELVFDAALHAVNHLPRWLLVSHDQGAGDIRAEATSRVFRFVDDVHIHVSTQNERVTVSVRSASRVGRGDFGQNARNIQAFFVELDRQVSGDGKPLR